ncbi:hypothetical protein Cgig2_014034 [Carnegiea gigantea]|uniref:TFIIF beta subunit HTH domain-containing protein n=1 Tax=Carnegiea gigantea TaxID=171969 RepID=A0A9Q1KZA4_9CARY|nr:hypothetical protein Cgig2_014034 [Carnegiea gigantea]
MEGSVDTSKAERAVWLMKCPALVSRSLSSSSSSSSSSAAAVAKVVVSIDPLRSNDSHSTQFTMELAGTELGNVPKFYSMDMSKDFVPMSIFSESQGKISVEGKIFNKFDMRPQYEAIDSYGKLCRERTKKYMTKNRQIQVIGLEKPMIPMPGMITHVQEKRKPPVKASETKRTRRDRGEMEDIMFKLFEQQSNWTLKELIVKTDQPEQFMKEILKGLCVYNNKGANQGTYELKPEYKRSIQDPNS